MHKSINTKKAPDAIGPYSQAMEAKGMLFISGQIPVNPENQELVKGDIKVQAEQVLNNLKAILEEAGYSLENVVKTTCLITDMDNFAAMNEVYAKFFSNSKPARAAFEVSRLPKDVDIEIEAVAVK